MDRPALSKGGMEVAATLWDVSPATVRTVYDAIVQRRGQDGSAGEIDFTTVQTYLRRLETKGYASSKLSGRIRVYASRTKPRTVIRDTVNDLVDRLFGGQAMPLVRHLIEDRGIGQDELDELRQLLDRLETEGHDEPQ